MSGGCGSRRAQQLGAIAALVAIAAVHAACAQNEPPAPDAALWLRIQALLPPSPTTQPYDKRFAVEGQRRQVLLDLVRRYQRLYPGGSNRDEALRIELETLFETGCAEGHLEALRDRVQEVLDRAPHDEAAQEAAYWRILCMQLGATSSAPTLQLTPLLREQFDRYTRQYPAAPRTPRLVEHLFDDARARDDRAEMARIVDQALRTRPDHPTTDRLLGRLWRVSTDTRTLTFSFGAIDGQAVGSDALAGRAGIVVVWSCEEPASIDRLFEVQQAVRGAGEAVVIGLSVDDDADPVRRTCQAKAIDVPVGFDPHGAIRRQARRWGVDALPCVMVVDRLGRVVCVTEADDWRECVRRALLN